jgi:hypothetical protein
MDLPPEYREGTKGGARTGQNIGPPCTRGAVKRRFLQGFGDMAWKIAWATEKMVKFAVFYAYRRNVSVFC